MQVPSELTQKHKALSVSDDNREIEKGDTVLSVQPAKKRKQTPKKGINKAAAKKTTPGQQSDGQPLRKSPRRTVNEKKK